MLVHVHVKLYASSAVMLFEKTSDRQTEVKLQNSSPSNRG